MEAVKPGQRVPATVLAARYNATLAEKGRHDIEWIAVADELRLRPRRATAARTTPIQPADVDRMNAVMRKLGCATRYRADGSDYQAGGQ